VPAWVVRIYRWCDLCGQRAVAEGDDRLCVMCIVDVDVAVERLTSA